MTDWNSNLKIAVWVLALLAVSVGFVIGEAGKPFAGTIIIFSGWVGSIIGVLVVDWFTPS